MAIEITIKIDDVEVKATECKTDDDRMNVSCYARWFNEDCPCWTKKSGRESIFLNTATEIC